MTDRVQYFMAVAALGVAILASPVATAPQSGSTSTPQQLAGSESTSQSGEYLIGPEDVLEIMVWKQPDLTRTVAVRPDGRISLPLLNDVTASNVTVAQLRDVLAKGYSRFVPEAEVSVMLKEIHSKWISVMGKVKQPGRYPLRSKVTVLEALSLAGGFDTYAKTDQLIVYRQNGRGGWTPIAFDYSRLLGRLDIQQNFVLQHGDIIVVP